MFPYAILQWQMPPTHIAVVVVVCFIKTVICDKGYIKDIYMQTKFNCERASKYFFYVQSQIQCIHYCIRKNCRHVNYMMAADGKVNCEVLAETSECSSVMHEENWMAVSLEVGSRYNGGISCNGL